MQDAEVIKWLIKSDGTWSSRGFELKVRWLSKWGIKFLMKFSVRMPNILVLMGLHSNSRLLAFRQFHIVII
jgi:hypothetical protein